MAKKNKPEQVVGLVGSWFHRVEKKKPKESIVSADSSIVERERIMEQHFGDGNTVTWQGQIIEQVSPGAYLVQIYSWWDGLALLRRIVSLDDMVGWQFYESNESMLEWWKVNVTDPMDIHLRREREEQRRAARQLS